MQHDYKQGLCITHIAKKHELSRGTIYNYLKQITPPRKTKRKTKPAQLKLQPYYEAIVAYDAEHFTTNQILKKIRLAGYDGNRSALRRFLEPYRANKKKQFAQTLIHRISRVRLSQWIWRGFKTIEDDQKQIVTQCQNLYPFIEPVEKMAQKYRTLFQKRAMDGLLDWVNTQLVNK